MNARTDRFAALRDRIERAHAIIREPQGATDRIVRRSTSGSCELSFAQARLWFLDQLVPGNPFYNIPAALPLRLVLDEEALRRALAEVVRRHESLRTTFQASPDGPRQRVGPPYDPMATAIDLSALAPPERQQRLQALATDEARAPFDLTRGPLVRSRLVRLAAAEHVLLLTLHHIVSDGWSMGVFFRELMQLYDAFRRGARSPLPEPELQYADYAAWQRRQLSPQRIEALLAYWRGQLQQLPTLALVTDRPRPAVATFRGAFFDVAVDAGLTDALATLAGAQRATLFQVLLAAFMAVLARHAGQTDIVVGAPIANRTRPEIEGLIGFFVNSLVLRTDLGGDPGFDEIVERVRRTTIAAYEHQDLPFEKLVEELQPARDMSRNPLAQVTFQIQNAPGATREKPEGLDQIVRIDRATAIFDLAFSLWETRSGLVGGIEFATDIFDPSSIATLVESWQNVLVAVVADASVKLSALPLAPSARADGPSLPVPTGGLFDAFEAACLAAPDDTVLIDADGALTRGALRAECRALASAMAARGVGAGDCVALVMPRGRRFVRAMVAALAAGAAWMPIDPAWPAARVARLLQRARPRLVLHEDDPLLDAAVTAASATLPPVGGDAAAYLLFTSGSTGEPKGVVVSQRALLNHMAWMRAELAVRTAGGRVLQRTPLHFDASVWELWAPLLGDGTLLLPPPFEAADTGRLAAAVDEMGASVLQLVPSLLRLLLDDPAAPRCAGLQRICIGGEALAGDLVAKVRARWPQVEIVNLYGPTETTIDASWWVAAADQLPAGPAPLGRPIANLSISVRDDAGRALPAGVVGEIWIAGAGLADGYLDAPTDTAERFVTTADGCRHYRSGDLGWLRHDGLLFSCGRVDQQVKVRGNRVELGEIEAALAAQPGVQAASVLAVGDESGGTAATELVAFVSVEGPAVLGTGDEPERLERSHVADWQALYHAVYEPAVAAADPAFDTVGWVSSYDGQPIAATAMRDWLDATLARLRALAPRRVLEVGCGAGLIAGALAPRCQRYVACDFSAPALERARRALAGAPARLVRCSAHEIGRADTVAEQGFDLVILNSVVQYFPSLTYLLDVLRQAQALLAPGGHIFVGDVRHHGLMEAFHADVLARRSGPGLPPPEARERLRAAVAQDKELLVAPAWFWSLPAELPALGRVAVRCKRGRVRSEMLDYRYDVVLESGPPVAPPALAWHDWRRGGFELTMLGDWLATLDAPAVGIGAIPNARVCKATARLAELGSAAAEPLGRAVSSDAVDPEDLAAAVEAGGWSVELMPSPLQADHLDAVVWRARQSPFAADAALKARGALPQGRLASNPLLATIGPALEQRLKARLAEQLPAVLVPTRIEPLAELPLLHNGKVDRRALAALASHRRAGRNGIEEPADALEGLLAQIWSEVLRLKRVGVEDHFFNDLGGHSLLATQVVSRVREALEIDLPLRLLFEHSTVRRFAAALVHDLPGGPALVDMAALVLQVHALDEREVDQLLEQGAE
jgi:amino acid adenylation domain-containing protein